MPRQQKCRDRGDGEIFLLTFAFIGLLRLKNSVYNLAFQWVVDPGGIQNALGADGGLRHRNGESRTPVAERISWGREPDLETSDQGSTSAFGRSNRILTSSICVSHSRKKLLGVPLS